MEAAWLQEQVACAVRHAEVHFVLNAQSASVGAAPPPPPPAHAALSTATAPSIAATSVASDAEVSIRPTASVPLLAAPPMRLRAGRAAAGTSGANGAGALSGPGAGVCVCTATAASLPPSMPPLLEHEHENSPSPPPSGAISACDRVDASRLTPTAQLDAASASASEDATSEKAPLRPSHLPQKQLLLPRPPTLQFNTPVASTTGVPFNTAHGTSTALLPTDASAPGGHSAAAPPTQRAPRHFQLLSEPHSTISSLSASPHSERSHSRSPSPSYRLSEVENTSVSSRASQMIAPSSETRKTARRPQSSAAAAPAIAADSSGYSSGSTAAQRLSDPSKSSQHLQDDRAEPSMNFAANSRRYIQQPPALLSTAATSAEVDVEQDVPLAANALLRLTRSPPPPPLPPRPQSALSVAMRVSTRAAGGEAITLNRASAPPPGVAFAPPPVAQSAEAAARTRPRVRKGPQSRSVTPACGTGASNGGGDRERTQPND